MQVVVIPAVALLVSGVPIQLMAVEVVPIILEHCQVIQLGHGLAAGW